MKNLLVIALVTSGILSSQLSFAQWVPQISNTTVSINDFQFLDPINGFYCGTEGIFKTTDGGNTWTKIPFTTPDSVYLNGIGFEAIHFFNATTAVAAGFVLWDDAEIIIRTTNGGATWSIVHTGPNATAIKDMSFNSSNMGVAVGEKGRILTSSNGGISWSSVTSTTNVTLNAVAFRTTFGVHAVGDRIIVSSSNGGNSWTSASAPVSLFSLFFTSTSAGYLVGEDGVLMQYIGGTSFQAVPTNATYDFTGIYFTSADTGYICTDEGYVLQTTNHGQLLEKQKLNGSLNCIYFSDSNKGFTAGFGGVMYKTSNQGGFYGPIIPPFTTTPTVYCPDSTIALNNTGPSIYTYTWTVDGQPFSTSQNATYTLPSVGGSVNVIKLIAYNGHVYDTTSKTISTGASLGIVFNATLSVDSLCSGSSSTITVANSQLGTSYQLKRGTSNVGSAQNGNGNTLTFNTGSNTVTNNYSLIGTRNNSCSTNRDTINFTVYVATPNKTLTVSATKTQICKNDSSTILLHNSEAGVTYQLKKGNANIGITQTGNGSTLGFPTGVITADATYSIAAVNYLGCTATLTQTQLIDVRQLTVDFTLSLSSYTVNDTIQIVNGSNADSYIWSFGADASVSIDTHQTPQAISYSSIGLKNITLIGNTTIGCNDTISKNISIYEDADSISGSTCLFDSLGFQEAPQAVLDYHVDINGNTYIAGYFNGCGANYTNGGSQNIFLKKYDQNGNLLWEKRQTPCNYSAITYWGSFITGIATDQNENVYVTGNYTSCEIDFDQFHIRHSNCNNNSLVSQFYVLKLDSSGLSQWIIHTNRSTYNSLSQTIGGTDILYADDDHIYVSIYGTVGNTWIFADSTAPSPIPSGDNSILQINAEGKFKRLFPYYSTITGLYQTPSGGVYSLKYTTISPKMKISSDGDIYLVGKGGAIFNTFNGVSDTASSDFVGILDTLQGWKNAFSLYSKNGSGGYEPISNLIPAFTLDQNKNLYLAFRYGPNTSNITTVHIGGQSINTFQDGSFIVKYDSTGQVVWYNEGSLLLPRSIELTVEENELIIYGDYASFVGVSSQNIPPKGVKSLAMREAFLMTITSDGNLVGIKTIGDTLYNYSYFMEREKCNNLFHCIGVLNSTSTFLSFPGDVFLLNHDISGLCQIDTCLPEAFRSEVSGSVVSPLGSPVRSVSLTARGSASTRHAASGPTGSYSLFLTSDASYTVSPAKNNDLVTNNGITMLDVLYLRRHILGQQLSSPYKIIAADVNGSGSVTMADVLLIRSLVLQTNITFPGNKLWAFVPHDFVFANPANPFPFDTARTYASISQISNQDFIGMKLGDVNNSWDRTIAKNSSYAGTLYLDMECAASAYPGEEIIIRVRARQFNDVSGYQFTLSWNTEAFTFSSVVNGEIDNEFALQKTNEGKLGVLWTQSSAQGITLPDDAVLFYLRGTSKTAGECAIDVNSSFISMEAANGNLELLEVAKWSDVTGINDPETAGYFVFQNVPNPFQATTLVTFKLPSKENVSMEVYDVIGQKVEEKTAVFERGYHTVQVGNGKLEAGIYYLKFKAGEFAQSVKMVCIGK